MLFTSAMKYLGVAFKFIAGNMIFFSDGTHFNAIIYMVSYFKSNCSLYALSIFALLLRETTIDKSIQAASLQSNRYGLRY